MRGLLVAFVGLTLAAGSAFAELIPLTVDENSCTVNCPAAGAVVVDVELITSGVGTSTATVTFTGETVGTITYTLYSVLFNVNGSFGITQVNENGVKDSPTPGIVATSLDEYGSFSTGLTTHNDTSVEFFIDDGTWTSAANVLALTTGYSKTHYPSAPGFDAAAQVKENGAETAYDIAGYQSTVPEPSSVVMLGTVLLGLVGMIAIRRKRIQ